MDKAKLDKDKRRRILNGIQQWNNGIAPNGQIAPESCFVHNSVPNIITKNLAVQVVPTCTKSEWTENLLQSGVPSPYDPTTQESLSLCRVIFKDDPHFIKLETRKKSVVRYIQRAPNASVKVDDIARLTTEFTDELSKAEEHWPHNPKRSWDMLHDIWNRYGFLWPEKIYIGYETSPKDTSLYENSRDESQDRAQRSSVVFRSNLRPMYEFFPAAHINEKKFILEVIYHFSPSMLILKLDENEQSRSRIDRREETTTSLDNSALKSNSRQPVNGERSVPNSISNHKSSSLSLNEKWRLSVDSSSTYTTKPLNVNVSSQDRRVCSSFDYDAMLVNPEFSNVRTDHQKFTPQDLLLLTNKRPTTSDSPANEAKSPFSIMSFDDKFDFSSGERSESNSTQPTSSGSNSMSSPFIIKTMKTDHPKSLLNAPVPVKGIFLNSTLIDGKTDDGFQLKKKLATKTKQQQLDTVIEEIEKVSTTANNSSDATNNQTSKRSSVKDDLKHSKFTTYHPNNPILISNIVPTQVSNFDSKEGLMERTITFPEEPQVSQWLDGNEKLYSLTRNDTDANISIPANIIQSNTSSQYSTPAGSIKSIPSEEYVAEPIPTSSKKHGKQPAQKFQAHYQHRRSNSTEYDDWTPSSSPSPTTTTTTMRVAKSSSPSTLTEAETFKREVQQTYNTKDNAYSAIYKNIFLSTPTSNTTSQIQYYDDEDENDMYRCQGVSSQLRSFTMTPRSRYSQQTRSSSANLTAEEYMLRKKSRETSFMMLVPQETKQELLLRAVKQSTLSHWLQTFSANAKKLNQNMKVDSTSTAQTASIVSNDIDTSSSAVEIRLQHYSSKNRTIKKKKGFYHQKGSNRRQKGIIL